MALKKILVAYDGSDCADKALDLAIEIVRPNPEVHLDIVNIVPIPMLTEAQAASFQDITDMMMEDGKETLAQTAERIGGMEERVSTLVITGTSVAPELLKLLKGKKYDLLVIGCRGLSGIKEYMGSVSYKVFHGAEIPVLVAK